MTTFAQLYDDRLLQRAYKGAMYILRRATGTLEKPLGMSEEEFAESRARYEAGERTLMEVEGEQEAETTGAGVEEPPEPHELTEPAMEMQQRSSLFLTAQ